MKLYDPLDNAKCYERIRQFRWHEDVACPRCISDNITRQGKDEPQPQRQRYFYKNGHRNRAGLLLTFLYSL